MSAAVCPRRPVQLPYSERVNTMTGLRSELQLLNTASCLAQTDRTFGVVGGPVPTDARQGRHRQRYGANGERLVAGCIPIKWCQGIDGQQAVQVCMITTRGGKGLVFPKGGWEDDETVDCAARRETVEEAGVRGVLQEPMLGEFSFTSGKWSSQQVSACNSLERLSALDPTPAPLQQQPQQPTPFQQQSQLPSPLTQAQQEQPQSEQPLLLTQQHSGGVGGKCLAYMFVMEVLEELQEWPESNDRNRVWCDLSEAQARCKHEWMRQALIAMQGQMATSSGMPLPQLATIQAAQGQQQQLDTGSLASASSDTTAVGP